MRFECDRPRLCARCARGFGPGWGEGCVVQEDLDRVGARVGQGLDQTDGLTVVGGDG